MWLSAVWNLSAPYQPQPDLDDWTTILILMVAIVPDLDVCPCSTWMSLILMIVHNPDGLSNPDDCL